MTWGGPRERAFLVLEGLLVLTGLGCGLFAWRAAEVVARTDLALAAAAFVVYALAFRRARVDPFHRLATPPRSRRGLPVDGTTTFVFIVALLVGNGLMISDLRGELVDGTPTCAAPLIAGLNAALGLVVLASHLAQELQASGHAAALLGAPTDAPPRAALAMFGSAPRDELRRALWSGRLVRFLLVVTVLGSALVALWHPWLPPLHLRDPGAVYGGT